MKEPLPIGKGLQTNNSKLVLYLSYNQIWNEVAFGKGLETNISLQG